MKRIALYLDYDTADGGTYQYEATVLSALARYNQKKFEVIAFAVGRKWKKKCDELGIECISVKSIGLTSEEMKRYGIIQLLFPKISSKCLMKYTEFGKKLKKYKINLLFIPIQDMYLGYDIRTIRVCHDLNYRYESFPELSKQKFERNLSVYATLRETTVVLTDSKLGNKQFRESYHPKKTKVISLPFIAPIRIGEGELNKKELELIEKKVPKRFLFYPAQMWKHKNHVNLIKAINIAREGNKDIALVLAGASRNASKDITDTIKKYGLQDKVICLGVVSDQLIDYLYKNAVAMIMPSYHGPTNLPPLEAMSLGCPVAVSNRYAMPEQVGDAGLLFDPDSPEEIANCIEQFWNNEALRQRLIANGKARMSKWTEKEFAEKLCKIISKID